MLYRVAIITVTILLAAIGLPPADAATEPAFLYSLSNFSGTVPGSWVKLAADAQRGEVYVLDTGSQTLTVYNDSGMEIFRFPEHPVLSSASDVAVDGEGTVYLLCSGGVQWKIAAMDYRGEMIAELSPSSLSGSLPDTFRPDSLVVHEQTLYLADRQGMKVAVVPILRGETRIVDVAPLVGIRDEQRAGAAMVGFNVDAKGNILFTVHVNFEAYILSADGKIRSFGTRGSTPGKFNIAGGIATDAEGRIFVTDTLRCVVMAFDHELRFTAEFGYRGTDPGNLISPMDVAAAGGKLYVTQSRNRGVSVYRVNG